MVCCVSITGRLHDERDPFLVHDAVANILNEAGIVPAPEREKQRSWKQFMHAHWESLYACDFFAVETIGVFGAVSEALGVFRGQARDSRGPHRWHSRESRWGSLKLRSLRSIRPSVLPRTHAGNSHGVPSDAAQIPAGSAICVSTRRSTQCETGRTLSASRDRSSRRNPKSPKTLLPARARAQRKRVGYGQPDGVGALASILAMLCSSVMLSHWSTTTNR